MASQTIPTTQWDQNLRDKRSHGMDWQEKSRRYGRANCDSRISEKVQDIQQDHKLQQKIHEKLANGIDGGWGELEQRWKSWEPSSWEIGFRHCYVLW